LTPSDTTVDWKNPPKERAMATLRDLLDLKGREVIAVHPADSVLRAAHLMNERNIGGVVVLEGDRLAGIFTERDVLRRVVAPGLDPATTPVSVVMSTPVVTCPPELTVDDCAALMTNRGIRHLPVRDTTGLVGMVSIRDLLAHKVGEQEATIEQMNHYLFDVR
jgi:CBS domain-containing protein